MKYLIAIFFLLSFGCKNKENKEAENAAARAENAFSTQQLIGVFQDTLPCAGCPGVATTLYLKPDKTYIIEQAYLGKEVKYDIGKWLVTDSVLQLAGKEVATRFKLLNLAEIKLLDVPDSIRQAARDTQLSLKRVITPFKPLQPVPVEGMFRAAGDTMQMLVCATGIDYPVALAPDAMNMTAAYKQAAKGKNEPVYTQIKGHFELRPTPNDTTTQDFFIVERFDKFLPNQQCP